MSDANEKEWNDAGRAKGPQGETKSGYADGLVSNVQISKSHAEMGMGHGEGQRPKQAPRAKMTRGGKSFTTR